MNPEKTRRIYVNKNKIIIFNIASTIILQGLAFFSGPIFSGMLGPNNYGIASVYFTWVQIASTVFSLQAGGTLAVARVNFSENKQNEFQSSVLSLATLSYVCLSIITILIAFVASRWIEINILMVIFGLLHGWGFYCVSYMNNKFTYEFKADKNFILSVLIISLTIGLSIFLIYLFPKSINYWGRIIGQSSVYAFAGVFIFIYILYKGKCFYSYEYWKFTLPISIPVIFHMLANIVLNQSDKMMLQAMVGNSIAGIYALACTFSAVLNTIWNALNNSWVPFYYKYTQNNEIEKMRFHANNYLELFTILTMGFILLSREVFHLYAKQDFWSGDTLIPFFSIGYYFIFLYSFPVNYEFYNKKTKTIAVGTTFASVCNFILNVVFIKLMGIEGAVIATTISHGLQFVFHYIIAKRMIPGYFPFQFLDFIPGLFFVLGTTVFYMFTKDFWMIRWGIGAVLGCYILIKILRRKEIF